MKFVKFHCFGNYDMDWWHNKIHLEFLEQDDTYTSKYQFLLRECMLYIPVQYKQILHHKMIHGMIQYGGASIGIKCWKINKIEKKTYFHMQFKLFMYFWSL